MPKNVYIFRKKIDSWMQFFVLISLIISDDFKERMNRIGFFAWNEEEFSKMNFNALVLTFKKSNYFLISFKRKNNSLRNPLNCTLNSRGRKLVNARLS